MCVVQTQFVFFLLTLSVCSNNLGLTLLVSLRVITSVFAPRFFGCLFFNLLPDYSQNKIIAIHHLSALHCLLQVICAYTWRRTKALAPLWYWPGYQIPASRGRTRRLCALSPLRARLSAGMHVDEADGGEGHFLKSLFSINLIIFKLWLLGMSKC